MMSCKQTVSGKIGPFPVSVCDGLGAIKSKATDDFECDFTRAMPDSLVLNLAKIFQVIACQVLKMQGKALLYLFVLDTENLPDLDFGVTLQLAVDVRCR